MLVKKTKSGKFSCAMSHTMRDRLFNDATELFSAHSQRASDIRLNTEENVMKHLHLSVINEIITTKNFYLQSNEVKKIIFSRSEAIAIIWLMRFQKSIPLLDLKAALHQKLS